MIDFLIYLIASFIGTASVIALLYFILRNKFEYSSRMRRLVFAYFGVQDYLDLVRDSYEKLLNQKSEIQNVIKQSVGKDEAYVIKMLEESYKDLDKIMLDYQRRKEILDQELKIDEVEDNGLG